MSGYSAPFVSYLLRHRAELEAGVGLPRREWQLATRANRDWAGGAVWEYTTVLKADLARGLAWLTPIDRELVLAAHEPNNPTRRLYSQRPSARNAKLRLAVDGILDQLVQAMNGGDATVATKTNGTQAPTEPTTAEQPVSDLHDVIDKKLAKLPPDWEELRVRRGMAGSFIVKVVY